MALTLVTKPQGEPLTLAQAKHQVQQATNVDDNLLSEIIIPAVRERGELATQRAFLRQTWQLLLDGFPASAFIDLPKPPLISVSSVQYYDTGGTLRTLTVTTDYLVQAPAGPRCRRGRLALPLGVVWPTALEQMGSVIIEFVCGYGAAVDVPAALKGAMLLDVGTLYANREDVIRGTIVAALPRSTHDVYWSYRSHAGQRLAA